MYYYHFFFHYDRVKLIIEEIKKEEALLLEDLSSMDRKFAEHYNVCVLMLPNFLKFSAVTPTYFSES
jgi:hypothetical protein